MARHNVTTHGPTELAYILDHATWTDDDFQEHVRDSRTSAWYRSNNSRLFARIDACNVALYTADDCQCIHTLRGTPPNKVTAVRFFHDNMRVAVGAENGDIEVFSTTTGNSRMRLQGFHRVKIVDFSMSPDGRFMISLDKDNTMVFHKLARPLQSDVLRRNMDHHLTQIAFSRKSTMFATADATGYVNIWDIDGLRVTHMIDFSLGSSLRIRFSDSDKSLCATTDNAVQLYDLVNQLIVDVHSLNEQTPRVLVGRHRPTD